MMKKSLTLILNEDKPNDNKQYPIWLRITIDRKTNYISTGKFIKKAQWNAADELVKNHPLQESINVEIWALKNNISRYLATLVLENKSTTAKEIKELFTGNTLKSKHNFFDFADAYLEEIKFKKKDSTIEANRRFVRNLALYLGNRELKFEDVTSDFLLKYEKYLRSKVSNNYVAAMFKDFRMFFNAARKRKITDHYPFANYEKPVYEAPVKDCLNKKEIMQWIKYCFEVENNVLKQTAVYFMLGISTGMRNSDWFKFNWQEHIKDGWILLRAKKNGQWVSMPVNSLLKKILPLIKQYPLTIEEPTINEKLKEIATDLKINKHITTHTGRHTFAVTVCAENGISCETCAEFMGITVKTCVENYYRVTKAKIQNETARGWKKII